MFALTGATVNRIEDIQSANAPVSIVAVLSFYLAFFTMTSAETILNKVAMFMPFSSPFIMPINYINGSATIIEVIVSIVILIISVLIISVISIKVYKSAILNFGSKNNVRKYLKNIFKK